VFRVGEEPRDILGYGRRVQIVAAWVAMMLAGLLEYTWGALNPSLQAVHHWGSAPVFWAFSFFVIFESFVQIGAGYLRNRGFLTVRWATITGGLVCGVIGYGILAETSSIWLSDLGYAVLGGIGFISEFIGRRKTMIYAFKALGGSFAGGLAALLMTGTLYGTAKFHWAFGFFFGAALGALAALTVAFLCQRPTSEQMERAVAASEQSEAGHKPAIA
jgi:hypothetical protein